MQDGDFWTTQIINDGDYIASDAGACVILDITDQNQVMVLRAGLWDPVDQEYVL
jgi:hypothetical protein